MGVDHGEILGIGRKDIDLGSVQRIADSLVRRGPGISLADFGEHFGSETTLGITFLCESTDTEQPEGRN